MFWNKPKEIKEEIKITELDLIQKSLSSMMIEFANEPGNVEDGLEEKEKLELYSTANNLVNNKAFREISKFLINKQGNYTIRTAEDYVKVCFGRAVINGIELIDEEVKRLNGLFLEANKPKEDFDTRKVI